MGKLIDRIPGSRLLISSLPGSERMLNRSASLAMSTSVLKALPGKLDIKRHSPSILYLPQQTVMTAMPHNVCKSTNLFKDYQYTEEMELIKCNLKFSFALFSTCSQFIPCFIVCVCLETYKQLWYFGIKITILVLSVLSKISKISRFQ